MKNLSLLITFTAILFSCSYTNPRKQEIERRIQSLKDQIHSRINKRNSTKARLNAVVAKYQSVDWNNLSYGDSTIKDAQYQFEVQEIELKKNALDDRDKIDNLQIKRLEQEYELLP